MATSAADLGLARRRILTPVGSLWASASGAGLREARWSRPKEGDFAAADRGPRSAHLDALEAQLARYFNRDLRRFDLPLDLVGTPFQRAAWEALLGIPHGATRSYRDQAAAMGRPDASRAVGAANARNPIAIVLPCHRVVGVDGAMVGYAGGLDVKERLLALERGQGLLF